jgi:hypothetical protein
MENLMTAEIKELLIKNPEGLKKIRLESDLAIELVCGESSLTMLPNGNWLLKGTAFTQVMDTVVVKAQRVDYCS